MEYTCHGFEPSEAPVVDSWRRVNRRPLKERTVLALKDGEMSNSNGLGVTSDKNSSNFKIYSSRNGSGSG